MTHDKFQIVKPLIITGFIIGAVVMVLLAFRITE